MVASHCVQHIVDKAAMMPPPSDDLPNVFLMDTTEVVPDQNDITVQGIREKSKTTSAREAKLATAGLQTNSTMFCFVGLVNPRVIQMQLYQ